jgi:hypothetical protein
VFLANGKIVYATILYCLIISAPAFGTDMQQEIDHLLQFVEHTECQYERNGQLHSGKEAAEHIKTKYNYFKSDLDSTEKFVELSATKSTISGKYYFVHCPNRRKLKSQEWLLEELKTYRKKEAD